MKHLKTLFGILVACACALTLLAAGAHADQAQAKKYKLWVGGKQVTSKNAKHVLGNSKVKYNAKTHTLTLKKATIKKVKKKKVGPVTYYASILDCTGKNLKIKLVGKNTISAKKTNGEYIAGIGRGAWNPITTITIYGSGSLKVSAGKAKRFSYGIAVDKLVIKGKAKVKAYGKDCTDTSMGIWASKLTLKNSAKVTAQGVSSAFNGAPTFSGSYTPKVKAGYSSSNIAVSQTSPTSSVYAKYPYVTISKSTSKKPGKVTISSITPMASGLGVRWNVLKSNCTGYQYQLSKSSSFPSGGTWSYTSPYKMNGGYINGASATNLSGGTTYYVRVRGVNKTSSKTYYGPWSGVKSTTTYMGEAAG